MGSPKVAQNFATLRNEKYTQFINSSEGNIEPQCVKSIGEPRLTAPLYLLRILIIQYISNGLHFSGNWNYTEILGIV